MTVSARVAITIVAVVAVFTTAALTVVLSVQAADRHAQFRETHSQALNLLALAIAPALAVGDHQSVQASVDSLANAPERAPVLRTLEVIAPDKRVVAALDPRRFNMRLDGPELEADLKRLGPSIHAVESDRVHVVIPIPGTQALGVLRGTLDEGALMEALHRDRLMGVGMTLLLAGLLGLALYGLLERQVGRRLAGLSAVAARLGAGERSARADESGLDEIAALGSAFNRMARDLTAHTADLEQLVAARTRALEEANARLGALATTDGLTGLKNRRAFEEQVTHLLEVARRTGRPLSLVVLDVDSFKAVNDTYGHQVGDVVLRGVASALRNVGRASDVIARVGGEEFAVAMPDTGLQAACQGAERIRRAVAAARFPEAVVFGDRGVTVSLGVAAFPDQGADISQVFSVADRALYTAKRTGKDRVMAIGRPEIMGRTSGAAS